MYYISRVLIPPLERIFNLVGADVRSWFFDVPRRAQAEDAEQIEEALASPDKQDQNEPTDSRDLEPAMMETHQSMYRCPMCGDAGVDPGASSQDVEYAHYFDIFSQGCAKSVFRTPC